MKVLLCEDVDRLGWLGDVVEVKDGYARNYLLPQGLAMVPTEANLRSLADEKEKRAEQRMQHRKLLERMCEAIKGAEAVVASKANELGHLFGSVTNRDIAANLREQGFEVADDMVKLDEHIKEVGTSTVTVRFAEDLKAMVSVVVVNLGQSVEEVKAAAEAARAAARAEAEAAEKAEAERQAKETAKAEEGESAE
jgi:large subunit ribosomal protein L9